MQQRKLVSDAEGRCSDCRSWRAILHRHDDYAASIRKSGPEIKNRCTQEGVNGEKHASILKSGLEIKNRCTQEGVNEEILALIRKFGPEIKNRCTQVAVNRENLTSIRKSGPEIKNRCTKDGVNGENLASIPKSSPEIKNRCTQQGINRQNLALILKFGPEIMNRCTKQSIFSTHPQHASSAHPPARVHHALTTRLALDVLHGDGLDAGSAVAAKAGADAPGGGIPLCFCRRGCAAPA